MAASARYADAYAYEAITVGNTAIGITATLLQNSAATENVNHKGVFEVFLSVETNAIRYRIDGTDPTASEGHPLAAGDKLTVTGYNNIKRLRMIRQSADAAVKVTLFR